MLWLEPDLPTGTQTWKEHHAGELGKLFLYHNRIPPEQILLCRRLPVMALALAFGATGGKGRLFDLRV